MVKANISGLVSSSIVDGPGIRFAVYMQGCNHKCKGCHNINTWSTKENELIEIDDIIKTINAEALLKNVTISGGDPLLQYKATIDLAKKLKEENFNIWLYTGYTLNQILENEDMKIILKYIDVLVDGKFDEAKKDLNLKFKGSTNQNIIDCSIY